MNSQIEDKNNTISSLNSTIYLFNRQISLLNSYLEDKQSQINQLQDIVNLAKSKTWTDSTIVIPASQYAYWTPTANYAGYVEVSIQTSNVTGIYVRVIYSSHGVNYDNQLDVVVGGRAVFPILPSTSIEIRVGTNPSVASSINLAIVYYY